MDGWSKGKFGRVSFTPGVLEKLTLDEILGLLERHGHADWGDLPTEAQIENNLAAIQGLRVMSVYLVRGTKVWVITENNRSATTVLLPEEY